MGGLTQLGWVLEQVLYGQLTRLSLPARVWLRETRLLLTRVNLRL